jgi:hypothetical protein
MSIKDNTYFYKDCYPSEIFWRIFILVDKILDSNNHFIVDIKLDNILENGDFIP